MKKLVHRLSYPLAVVSFLLGGAGCQKSSQTLDSQSELIQFSTQIESVATMAQASKAGFVVGDKIGVWVVPFALSSADGQTDKRIDLRPYGNYVDNVIFQHDGSKFVGNNVYYPKERVKVDLYGVYPHDSKMSDRDANSMSDPKAYQFSIKQDQTATGGVDLTASDFLSALTIGAQKSDQAVDLLFKHRLGRVLVGFNVMNKYKGYDVRGVKSVLVCGIPLTSTINIVDNAAVPVIVSANNPTLDIAAYRAESPSGVVVGPYIYEAIVTPGAVIAQNEILVKIILVIDNLGDVEFQSKAPSQVTYLAQKQININVSLMDEVPVSLAGVTIEGWGTPIDYSGVTTKLSNMHINCEAESGATINGDAVSAQLTIQGDVFSGVVKYDQLNARYSIQYDHVDNFGGYLENIVMKDALGQEIFSSATFPVGGLQIKGNPTLDSYSTIIGKMIFKGDGTVEFKKL